MSKFKTVCGVIAFVLFFLMLGAVGAIEQDIVPLFPGMVRVFALMALWVLFCNLAGAFDYTGPFIYVELADNEFYSEGQNGRKEVLKCYAITSWNRALRRRSYLTTTPVRKSKEHISAWTV